MPPKRPIRPIAPVSCTSCRTITRPTPSARTGRFWPRWTPRPISIAWRPRACGSTASMPPTRSARPRAARRSSRAREPTTTPCSTPLTRKSTPGPRCSGRPAITRSCSASGTWASTAGFDDWEILPGQGVYNNPMLYTRHGQKKYKGHVTDVITDEAIHYLDNRPKDKPFFAMVTTRCRTAIAFAAADGRVLQGQNDSRIRHALRRLLDPHRRDPATEKSNRSPTT